MSVFEVGDYIEFTRIIQPKQPVRFRTNYETGAPICLPEIPEQVLPQRGQGQIVKFTKERRVAGTKYEVASVSAGSALGTVIAILEDAVLVGKPLTMFDLAPDTKDSGPNVYSSDAKGIA